MLVCRICCAAAPLRASQARAAARWKRSPAYPLRPPRRLVTRRRTRRSIADCTTLADAIERPLRDEGLRHQLPGPSNAAPCARMPTSWHGSKPACLAARVAGKHPSGCDSRLHPGSTDCYRCVAPCGLFPFSGGIRDSTSFAPICTATKQAHRPCSSAKYLSRPAFHRLDPNFFRKRASVHIPESGVYLALGARPCGQTLAACQSD